MSSALGGLDICKKIVDKAVELYYSVPVKKHYNKGKQIWKKVKY